MNTIFGEYIREKREALRQSDRRYSLRQVAGRINVQPSYLSKIERGEHQAYLVEDKIKALANELNEDPDVLFVDCRDPVPRKCQVIVPVHDRGRPGSISYQA